MTATAEDIQVDVDLTLEIPCSKDGCTNPAVWYFQFPCGSRINACASHRVGSDERYALVRMMGAFWYCTPHPDEIMPFPVPWRPL